MAVARSVRTYLEAELAKAVAHASRVQGRSASAIIAEAVRLRLSAEAAEAAEAAEQSVRRQLNRLELRFDKLLRDQAILRESVLLFIRVWLEHNPPLDDAQEEAAAASAEARFERFLDLIVPHLSPGNSLADLTLMRAEPGNREARAAP
ncbi:MAG: CopG family transcriptional regulator [Pseudomonadota bacterium]